ncbi:MAG TPA: 16S rRNA (guanine(966)-N(2))-methyltransferase RsmD [Methylibium sp.]|uniref:16S rRNA (guanine(966)-N(2))-methyltransferase RsmD n=1 Tax=Methylibium sp. TaxID=2067992 RepID=UPI002DBDDD8F|nr:16S rRNA (guanine(966)-N(2))-methyltransferase RsmD [Methylibium sp.]HEU4457917.1 16S rRNA (guanine(966)-N(2))-methyltransferase RsmD [Methylibium sp.]
MPPPRSSAANRPGQVRIVGGAWKRRRLPVPDRPGLRPTPDRVRETLFNWLGQELTGWRCLDAFAGSGALGFEAASRGAGEVLLIERDAALHAALRGAQAMLGAAQVRIEAADAIAWMRNHRGPAFDLVLLDPPFDAGLFEPALQAGAGLVASGGWLYLEADRAFPPGLFDAAGLHLHRHLKAGQVHAHLARRAASDA